MTWYYKNKHRIGIGMKTFMALFIGFMSAITVFAILFFAIIKYTSWLSISTQ